MNAQKIKIWIGLFLLTIIIASGLGFAYGDQSNLYRGIEPLSNSAVSSAATSVLNATNALTEVPVGNVYSPAAPEVAAPAITPIPSVKISLPTQNSTPTVELAPGENVASPCENNIPVIKNGKIVSCANKTGVKSMSTSAPATDCQSQGKLTYIGADTPTLKYGQCIGG